ncbi:MAG: nickel/cobalt transporter [Chloroflexota bacterium]
MSPRSRLSLAAPVILSVLALLALPAVVAAHPLGNFTINHFAGLWFERDQVLLDVVIDQAEIPTFQVRQDLDQDGDGDLSDEEIEAARSSQCERLGRDLRLTVADAEVPLTAYASGLAFPPGAGGLPTMRIVCEFAATLSSPVVSPTRIGFEDRVLQGRLGWHEIVADGSGVTLAPGQGTLRTASVSNRLTSYPADLIASPLRDPGLTVSIAPGGPVSVRPAVPDAAPLAGPAQPGAAAASAPPPPVAGPPAAVAVASPASVPGGVAVADLPSIFRTTELTPLILLMSLVTAAALGAGHALTPGHGKTLMAAYLVGSRGTPLHAAGLGLSVSVSHTIGILALAAIVIGAQGLLPPDLVARTLPLVAAVGIVAIGGWMLVSEIGRRRGRGHPGDHHHDAAEQGHEHSHGGVAHRHVPDPSATPRASALTWRSLFVLGLAGGIIPSTNALLILLGAIATGRPAFGLVLVVAFGLGMAVVMAGVGLAMIVARGRLSAQSAGPRLAALGGYVPLGASVVVLTLGVYLTAQALVVAPAL